MVVHTPRVPSLLFAMLVLSVAGIHSFNPQQPTTKNEFHAAEVEISLLVNQMAVLRLLNDSSRMASLHEREFKEMRDLRLELDLKTRELKMDLANTKNEWENITAASLESWQSVIAASIDGWQNMTAASIDGWQSMTAASLESWQSVTAASLESWQNMTAASIDGWQSMTAASIDGWQSVIAASIDDWQSMTAASIEDWQSMTAASLEEINKKKQEYQTMTAASFDEWQSMTAASLAEINRKTENTKQYAEIILEKDGWRRYQSSYYKLFDGVGNQTLATADCRGRGGFLASIGSEGENSFLAGIAVDYTYIGLSDEEEEGVFTWQDGSPFSFSNWRTSSGEPNNYGGNEDCVMLYHTVLIWNDIPCDRDYDYICEISFQ